MSLAVRSSICCGATEATHTNRLPIYDDLHSEFAKRVSGVVRLNLPEIDRGVKIKLPKALKSCGESAESQSEMQSLQD